MYDSEIYFKKWAGLNDPPEVLDAKIEAISTKIEIATRKFAGLDYADFHRKVAEVVPDNLSLNLLRRAALSDRGLGLVYYSHLGTVFSAIELVRTQNSGVIIDEEEIIADSWELIATNIGIGADFYGAQDYRSLRVRLHQNVTERRKYLDKSDVVITNAGLLEVERKFDWEKIDENYSLYQFLVNLAQGVSPRQREAASLRYELDLEGIGYDFDSDFVEADNYPSFEEIANETGIAVSTVRQLLIRFEQNLGLSLALNRGQGQQFLDFGVSNETTMMGFYNEIINRLYKGDSSGALNYALLGIDPLKGTEDSEFKHSMLQELVNLTTRARKLVQAGL